VFVRISDEDVEILSENSVSGKKDFHAFIPNFKSSKLLHAGASEHACTAASFK